MPYQRNQLVKQNRLIDDKLIIMSEKEIITVNYEIPGFSNKHVSFGSNASLMDADTVLFCPATPSHSYDYYNGKPSHSDYESTSYKESTQHWQKELSNFLNAGKTVFLFLSEKESFYLKTGTREYKAKVTINHVNEHTNYEFLPCRIGSVVNAKGKVVQLGKNKIFSDYLKAFKKEIDFEAYLENVGECDIVLTGKDSTKVLGAIFRCLNGYVVVLPHLKYDYDSFVKEVKGKPLWKKTALNFGQKLYENLLYIEKNINSVAQKTIAPQWTQKKEFVTDIEKSIVDEIKTAEASLKRVKSKLASKKEQLENELELKHLLYETGKPLEIAVIKALKILGYKAENYNDGKLELDQVILSPEGYRYIGECEGKDSKQIDITKLRQLLDSLNEDFSRPDVNEKGYGILFGNPERLTEPKDRSAGFTEKCVKAAEREKVALVKTTDLFEVIKHLKENEDDDYRISCRNAIHDGLGKLVVFPKPNTKDKK